MNKISESMLKDIQLLTGNTCLIPNADMRNYTTFKVGGVADLLVSPTSAEQLLMLLNYCFHSDLPYFILGKGSNLIVSDKGIRGLVVSTLKLDKISIKEEVVTAECGTELSKLSDLAAKHGLSGLEFSCGIPGTVGGAVFMNAGAYEGEISKVLLSSVALELDKNNNDNGPWSQLLLDNASHDFSYRHSVFQERPLVHISSSFRLKPQEPEVIQTEINYLTASRNEKQPMDMPSAGSVFRRPEGFYVGKLIQDCGLRGYRIGDAAVSDKHCGFIVNLGSASASDILALIEHIRSEVLDKFGVALQTEVRFVGEV